MCGKAYDRLLAFRNSQRSPSPDDKMDDHSCAIGECHTFHRSSLFVWSFVCLLACYNLVRRSLRLKNQVTHLCGRNLPFVFSNYMVSMYDCNRSSLQKWDFNVLPLRKHTDMHASTNKHAKMRIYTLTHALSGISVLRSRECTHLCTNTSARAKTRTREHKNVHISLFCFSVSA